jgi:hypothetical protein
MTTKEELQKLTVSLARFSIIVSNLGQRTEGEIEATRAPYDGSKIGINRTAL